MLISFALCGPGIPVALVGLALAMRSLAAPGYLSRARSWLTLALAVVAVAALNVLIIPADSHLAGYSVLASWALVLAVALLLREPLRKFKLRLGKLSILLADLVVASCFLSIFLVCYCYRSC